MPLNVGIFVIQLAIIPLVLGVLMTIYWYSRKTYQGFGFWVLANLSISLGFVLIMLRSSIPDFFSILAGNALLIFGLVLMYDGLELFFERKAFNYWNYVVFGVYILIQTYLTFVSPNINQRIVLISGASFILELRIGEALLRRAPHKLRPTYRIVAIIFFISALVSLLRAVYTLNQTQPLIMGSDLSLAALSFGAVCSITVWTFYLFFLNSARLELDLHEMQQDLLRIADADRRKVVQLSLLDETSRSLAESMDELEIMQRTVKAVVNRFGYAEAAISLLVEDGSLEVAVIDGTENIGYHPGFRQKMGEGIIGHTAEKQAVYISGDIEQDPFYFSIGNRSGSAVCIPMLAESRLLGVLYVESSTKNAFKQDDIQTLDTLVRHAATAIQKARLYAGAQAHLRAISTLQSVTQTILSSLDLQETLQSVVQTLKDNFSYTFVSIYLLHGEVLRLGAQAGYRENLILYDIPASSGISGRCVLTKQIQYIRDVSADPAFLRASHDIESEICVPLIKDDAVLGVINVEAAPGRPLSEDDLNVLTALAGPVVIAIENARLHAEVRQLAMTDSLTGLSNRRAFDLALANEMERAARYNYPLSLLILDMDSFKKYNDHWGHPAGDERLKAVAALLREDIRSPDFIARYGGEEFALILPHTSKPNALLLAERLRVNAENCAPGGLETGEEICGYTFSIGVASFPEDGKTVLELLLASDQAEMTAKKLGKNRVFAAGGALPSPFARV